MKQLKVNEMMLRLLPRMIDKEIQLQEALLNQEIIEGDKRYLNFRKEALNALKDFKQEVIEKQ